MFFQWAGFLLITLALVYISRASLYNPGSHGFYRFFAWEFILGLVILNLPVWFLHPLTWHQLISWPLLLISLLLVIASLVTLRRMGKPQSTRAEPGLLALERTTSLVTTGIYRHIRHPMYASLFFLAWGTCFKNPTWAGIILAWAATFFLILTARVEENENIRFFGQPYQDYMKNSRMFIPGVF